MHQKCMSLVTAGFRYLNTAEINTTSMLAS